MLRVKKKAPLNGSSDGAHQNIPSSLYRMEREKSMPESYTDDEIVDIYRRGKSDRRIMQKLCELSCKPRDEVLTILHAAGEALPETPDREKKAHGLRISDEVWRKIIADRLNGAGIAEICNAYHVCKSAVGNWRKKAKALGIPLPDHQITSGIQCIPDKIRKEVEQMEEKKIFPSSPEIVTPVFSPLKVAVLASVDAYEAARRALGKAVGMNLSVCDGMYSVSYTVTMEGEHTS